MSLNIVFAGTPEFAAEHLKALLSSNHKVVAVYTQPDRPAGRGRKLTPSPVKTVAVDAGLPVYQPSSLKSADAQTELAAIGADILVVVAYGLLLPQAVLDTPRLGCINVHASLLPRWRGAAPIHRALLAGDARTGVTIMQMDIGLDTGAMLLKAECAIEPTDTSAVLHDRLIELGRPALIEALDGLDAGTLSGEPQDDALATYATKLSKAEGELDWHRPAVELDRQIRGLTPWPGSYTRWNGDTLKVQQACLLDDTHSSQPGQIVAISDAGLDVACGDGVLRLERIQLPGKKAMTVADVLRSRRADFEAQPKLGEAGA